MIPAIDADHHFWDPDMADCPWMVGPVLPIRRVFAPDDMRPLLAPAGVQKTILVQIATYIAQVLRVFGPKRWMMGTDWPVSLLPSDHQRTVDPVRDAISVLDEHDQCAVLWGAATAACQLDEGRL